MSNSKLERSDTLPFISNDEFERSDTGTFPLFAPDQFEYLLKDTSFNAEVISAIDITDVLESMKKNEQTIDHEMKLTKQDSIWKLFSNGQSSPELNISMQQVIEKECIKNGDIIYAKEEEKNVDLNILNFECLEGPSAPAVIYINDDMPEIKSEIAPIVSNGIASLSLQPMMGPFNFSLNIKCNKHNNNKWCFSNDLNKLFVQNLIAVPVEVNVNQWGINSYVNITPVFVESQNKTLAVTRCFIHQKQDEVKNAPWAKHIVQVENPDAIYKFTNNRHSVDIPLGVPPPGEISKTLFVKCGCWNTCVGGPDRKRFALVFTLFNSDHMEVGREVLTLKVCSCPKRDMDLEQRKGSTIPKKKSATKRLLKASKKLSPTKRIKAEVADDNSSLYEQLDVPVEFASKVKCFINQLTAEKMVRQNPNCQLPYPNL